MDHKSLEYLLNQNELNMGQRRWLELIKGYYCSINYHLRKAMSWLAHLVESLWVSQLLCIPLRGKSLLIQKGWELRLYRPGLLGQLRVQPTLVKKIKWLQSRDSQLMKIMDEVQNKLRPKFNVYNCIRCDWSPKCLIHFKLPN